MAKTIKITLQEIVSAFENLELEDQINLYHAIKEILDQKKKLHQESLAKLNGIEK